MPQRRPDEKREEQVFGHAALIEIWWDNTEFPWDGDEPLPPDSEGYDVLVRAHLTVGGESWTAYDSLSSIWISPDNAGRLYLEETTQDVISQAVHELKDEIKKTAGGDDIARAMKREKIAIQLGEQDK